MDGKAQVIDLENLFLFFPLLTAAGQDVVVNRSVPPLSRREETQDRPF